VATYILDTTTFSHYQRSHPVVLSQLSAHSSDTVGVTSVNIQEALGGWYQLIARSKSPSAVELASKLLAETVIGLASFEIFPLTVPAIHRYEQLLKLKLNVGGQDLRIAAIALELGAVVVTNNAVDFGRIPGLAWEDWTV
jgi:tRNA(fMet)-specific endonuclease VapC